MSKERIAWIDISKAFGILVVLIVHTGVTLGPVTFFGGMFYMPVFFVLSGMTFSYRPKERFSAFLGKKARRLLVPYFGYNLFLFAFFFVKDSLLTGQMSRDSFFPLLGILYSRNCLLPAGAEGNLYFMQILNSPTWFLTGLFVSLVLFWLLLWAARGEEKRVLALNSVLLLLAVLLHYLCPVLLPWSIDCALYAVSFLCFGWMASRKNLVERVYYSPLLLLLLLLAFVFLSLFNGPVNMSTALYGRSMILYFIVGTLGSLLCMELSLFLEKHAPAAAGIGAWIGRHTVPILCLHLFVYSLAGMVFGRLLPFFIH